MADDFVIQNGIEDNIEHANRLEPGSEQRAREWKCIDIQYSNALKEAELSAKIQDLADRAALEREKFEHTKLMEERDADIREMEAENAAKAIKWKTRLGIGGLVLSGVTLTFGWVTDHIMTNDIRNSAGERDQKEFMKDVKGFIKDLFHM